MALGAAATVYGLNSIIRICSDPFQFQILSFMWHPQSKCILLLYTVTIFFFTTSEFSSHLTPMIDSYEENNLKQNDLSFSHSSLVEFSKLVPML